MKTFMYAFVKGTDKAVLFYQKAFDAAIEYEKEDLLDDGTFAHVVLKFDGQWLGLSEQNVENPDSIDGEKSYSGNIMQFCLLFDADEEAKIRKAYEVLSQDATIRTPLEKVEYADLICDFTDKFGIRWCMAIEKLNT